MDSQVKAALDTLASSFARAEKRIMVRGILQLCHARQETIGYLPIAKAVGLFSGGRELAEILGQIMEDCHVNGRPLLPSLVIKSDTRMPGTGYFECARNLGYHIVRTQEAEYEFWELQMKKLGVQTVPPSADGVDEEVEEERSLSS